MFACNQRLFKKNEKVAAVCCVLKQLSGKDLLSAISSETSGDFETGLRAIGKLSISVLFSPISSHRRSCIEL